MNAERKSAIKDYASTTGMLYLFSLMLSMFSVVFIIDAVPKWIRFLVSFLFLAPLFYLAFYQGLTSGEKLYKKAAKSVLGDLHGMKQVHAPYYKCIYYVIGYVLPLWIVFIVATITKLTLVRFIGLAFTFPIMLLFSSVKVLDLGAVKPVDLAVFLPYVLVLAGVFAIGFVLKVQRLKKQQADIQSELRSFNN